MRQPLCLNVCVFLFLITPLMLPCSSGHAATYTGKVVDDEGRAIAGAAVVAFWLEARGTLSGGSSSRLNEVKETLTDNNGTWAIEGPSGVRNLTLEDIYTVITLLTGTHYTKRAQFIIYKPGYCPYGSGGGGQLCRGRPQIYGNGETLELPKLLDRTDREHAIPEPLASSDINYEKLLNKQNKLVELINEEQRNLGLRVTDFHKVYKSAFEE